MMRKTKPTTLAIAQIVPQAWFLKLPLSPAPFMRLARPIGAGSSVASVFSMAVCVSAPPASSFVSRRGSSQSVDGCGRRRCRRPGLH